MTITVYEAKFHAFYRNATKFIDTKEDDSPPYKCLNTNLQVWAL